MNNETILHALLNLEKRLEKVEDMNHSLIIRNHELLCRLDAVALLLKNDKCHHEPSDEYYRNKIKCIKCGELYI